MAISTTIKKIFFDMKMNDLKRDGYFIEYKEENPFWVKRLSSIQLQNQGNPVKDIEIVFLVGKTPHRFKVVEIFHTSVIPECYASAIKTEFAYAIKCISMTDAEAAQILDKRFRKIGLEIVDIKKVEADIHWLREKGLVKE